MYYHDVISERAKQIKLRAKCKTSKSYLKIGQVRKDAYIKGIRVLLYY